MSIRKPRRRRSRESVDAWGRIIRAALQSGIGAGLVQGINLFFPGHLTPEQAAWLSGGLGWLTSVLQNGLEEGGVIKPIFKGSTVEGDDDSFTPEEIALIRDAMPAGRR